jgi:hypothetical protein
MDAKTVRELMDEATEHGAVLAAFHFDSLGASAEAVRNALVDMLARLTKEPGVLHCKGEVEEAVLTHGAYSSCAEAHLLTRDFATLLVLAIRYAPVGVEILRPDAIKLSIAEAQDILLEAAQTSQEFANYVMSRVMSKEDYEKFAAALKERAERGKEMVEKES